jgi:hypothetical protein
MMRTFAPLAALVCLLLVAPVAAQEVAGEPPNPTEERPDPLPIKRDLTPQIPEDVNRPVPDYHVVQPGDTLFGISQAYFGTPYVWPVVWAFNEHITNPHWIYPGDVVYLRAPLPGDAPVGADGPDPFSVSTHGLSIALAGFLTERSIAPVGKVEFSPEDKVMLTFPDKVYVSVTKDEKKKMRAGKVYALLRQEGTVTDEEDDDIVRARRYRVVGAVRIINVSEDDKTLHTGVIVQAWEEIYRNDILYPYERQLLRVAPAKASNTVVGKIEDTLERRSLFGEQFYLLINRGRKDGVRVGNRFFAYNRWDGRSKFDKDEVGQLPYERVAQMLVIHVEEEYSTCLVTQSRRELEVGWRVEMYKGY